MARPFSASWLAELCTHFGLKAYELAQYLSMDAGLLSRLTSGRSILGPASSEALAPFLAASTTPVAPTLALAPPDAAPLLARLDYCQHHARRLRRELRPLQAQATVAARWAAGLPTLRAALPPDPGPAAEPDPAAAWPAWLTWHRHRWLDRRPTTLPPALSARYHLLRLQAEALEAEAAGLAALLPPPAGPLG